jgi:hypothetical protein
MKKSIKRPFCFFLIFGLVSFLLVTTETFGQILYKRGENYYCTEISIAVVDLKGKKVTNLPPEAFVITENGVKRNIVRTRIPSQESPLYGLMFSCFDRPSSYVAEIGVSVTVPGVSGTFQQTKSWERKQVGLSDGTYDDIVFEINVTYEIPAERGLAAQLDGVLAQMDAGNTAKASELLLALNKEFPREGLIYYYLGQNTGDIANKLSGDERYKAFGLAWNYFTDAYELGLPPKFASRAAFKVAQIISIRGNLSVDVLLQELQLVLDIGDVEGGKYKEALEWKRKLERP